MQIHIAEGARHISFANEFLKVHVPKTTRRRQTGRIALHQLPVLPDRQVVTISR